MMDTSMFWNLRRTLTYNRLINIIVGNRGGGKTYGAKQWAIDNFISKKEQFGYIRRYKDDLKEPMLRFFDDIAAAYPDYEFRSDSKYLYIREKPMDPKEKWTSDDIAGFGFILSTANNKKSISYPNITTLIFDEFLIDKGNVRYLANEPLALLNLYETIARPGSGHKRVRLFMLANAISITNPYFLFFDLKMPTKKDRNNKYIWLHPQRPILVEDVRNEAFIDAKRNTEFGALVAGTKYEEYSIDNKFILDDSTFIEKRSPAARYYFTFRYKSKTFGVWADFSVGCLWVSDSVDPSCTLVYSLSIDDHKCNTLLVKNAGSRGHLKTFIDAYKMGCVRFENMNIKNITYEVIKSLLN